MTGDGKLLKVSSLAALFVGLATLITGVVFALGDLMDMDAWLTAVEGLGASVYGVRTAILANVPSNTAKIRTKALCLLVLAVTVLAYLKLSGSSFEIAQLALGVVVCFIAVVAVLLSQKIVKDQLRK